ncbi:MAG: phosphoenolpyruvate synthase [Candidatus Lloydbacteria bacterium RIFCSPHIGHO2_01_FULL_49_22]|uniref:Phosphoenolpyruvate synthase n=1 Tax=Candidatus Lloydbacteria bacterium RIFCSPHIGHO2_01_FULL_49_22 TaxID=1798658 RepID=A0A1G2CYV3_9BACT|nr:MAG: phosphoenolpyruvate synthase [Candidatus Lloydbacteria bacterium RIFCSPHIGHO2_01_FULL_49_22]OGZ10172.1 MAG: phosphoenolpyruvate synthase [Candidatus Lloydbacteria bacterium RIFCSPHIGHO2_02_FULL_50_18]
MNKTEQTILWFDQVGNDDVQIVGGKNASLGEMYTALASKGIRVPNGFVVTAKAYRDFINTSGLVDIIKKELTGLDTTNIKALQNAGKTVRAAFLKVEFPQTLRDDITKAYAEISKSYGVEEADVAVRSSATAEDLPGASFAGEHETYLNVYGAEQVIKKTREAMASLFNDRAISYRVDKGFSHFDVALSVGVQKMARSDKGTSGVMFTIDTETGFRDVIEINASYGLGEMVVQGKVTPDEFMLFKPTLRDGFRSIVKKSLGEKKMMMVYTEKQDSPVKEISVPVADQTRFSLSDDEVIELAQWGMIIEEHYTARFGKPTPMDIEWAKDGVDGKLYIVQARPETVQSEKKGFSITEYLLQKGAPEALTHGICVGGKIATGVARVILSASKLEEFKKGEILITEMTDPDWEPIMKMASAIITAKGGRTSHAAIVSRELGIPAVIGIGMEEMAKLKTGMELTVDASSGSVGYIYPGKLNWEERVEDLSQVPETKTKIAMNVGSPEAAFMYAHLPHKGVGLAREEFIIMSQIGIHPKALLDYDKLDKDLKKKIDARTIGFPDKVEFYVQKLAEGIAQIAAASYPHQVIVRFSDFKTNEYCTLLGGEAYEPSEENPMLGWRGASRYYDPKFKDAFKLECDAILRVRNTYGLKNLHVMVPFCRTPEEGKKVLATMAEFGLRKDEDGLHVYVMCEIPSNVLRADEFLDIFDGFSIGSNDLTQCTVGSDRDSGIVAGITNEKDPAVKQLISMAIKSCKARGKYIGICGQAPSDFPDFLRFLIQEGIETVSLNPDSIIPMLFEVAEEEKLLGR